MPKNPNNGSEHPHKLVYRHGKKYILKKSVGPPISFFASMIAMGALAVVTRTINPTYFMLIPFVSFVVSMFSRIFFRPKLIELPPPVQKPELASSGDDEIDKMLGIGNTYLIGIHSVAMTVKDLSIKAQLESIENTCKSIFDQIGKRRNKLSEVTQFMDYYLPTTLKLLNSYQKLEQQGVSGENTNALRKSIYAALPTIREAFKNQLDNLYQDEMIDIATDIEVLQGIMQKNGLLDDDLKS